MRLSTKGRYGLMAMFELALEYGQGPIPLKVIANKQMISDSYLEQLFSTLRKNELIKSIRGAQGGYILAKEPKDISVGDVLRVLEGDLAPTDCVSHGEDCGKQSICGTKSVFIKIKNSIDEVIDNVSLQDMVDEMENNLK